MKHFVHPYIPNSAPESRKAMLEHLGINSVDDIYQEIPEHLQFKQALDIPAPLLSEAELKRHVERIMAKNTHCGEVVSFLGAGCYQHHVPSICDEINSRSEFLTAYAGEPYDDHGRFQALFEYTSMMTEMLNMEIVSIPVYDGYQAAGSTIRICARKTGRNTVLRPKAINPDKRAMMNNYCRSDINFIDIDYDPATGTLDLEQLKAHLSTDIAAVYFENPNVFGVIEDGQAIIDTVKAVDSNIMCAVSVDPITLGVLTPPADYGADIVCGDIQPLGMHMSYGGGQGGFIACHDDVEVMMQFPTRLMGIAPTSVPGEYGFGDVAYERTSFDKREEGNEWVGTAAALWGITAGVYLALHGPDGMTEIGGSIMKRSLYMARKLAQLPGVEVPFINQAHFKEFVVDFSGTGKSVAQINKLLEEKHIFGGVDLSDKFPNATGKALYCVTEVHSQQDIDEAVKAIEEVIQ